MSKLRLLGHYWLPVYPWILLASSIWAIIHPEENWLQTGLLGLGMLLIAAMLLGHRRDQLCERCAASTPLNGSQMAEDYRRWLRLYHWAFQSMHRFLVVTLGGPALVLALKWTLDLDKRTANTLSLLLFTLPWAIEMWATWRHHRVQPWCPQCHWGRGGGHEEVVPDPDPSISK